MKKIYSILSLFFLMSYANAQNLDLGLGMYHFVDNQEFDSEYNMDQTMIGSWLFPRIGLSFEKTHEVVVWSGFLKKWGGDQWFEDSFFGTYYHYHLPEVNFYIGSFPRQKLSAEYSSALISDSICYYRPMIQGFLLQKGNAEKYAELFLDWTSFQTEAKREQFMIGGAFQQPLFQKTFLGIMGYYYHYAKTKELISTMFIQDYAITNPYVKWDFSSLVNWEQFEVKLGALVALERDRSINKWEMPIGLFFETKILYKRLLIENSFYLGHNQLVFGKKGLGEFYWNDSFFGSSLYNKLALDYFFINRPNFRAKLGVKIHLDDNGNIDNQQLFTLQLDLDKHFFRQFNRK